MTRRTLGLALGGGLLIALAVAILAASGGAGGNKTRVKADLLNGYQETPGVASAGSGTFQATIDDDATPPTITFTETYVGLTTPALVSHIHFGNRFDAGGVSVFLCGGTRPPCPPGTTTEATVSGTITPADVVGPANQGIGPGDFAKLVAAMRAGETYVNVHTATFPGGEIRGQVNNDDQRQPQ